MEPTTIEANPRSEIGPHVLAALTGIFIALGLLKFGNPVVLSNQIAVPTTLDEWRFQAWPMVWAYLIFIPLLLAALKVGRWKKPHPIMVGALVWLAWQFISATQTVSPSLTSLTLNHFTATFLCLGIGWFALAEVKNFTFLWIGLLLGFFGTLRTGFQQHFGGLEASRQYFELYILPNLAEPPTELMQKMTSLRIFSTLFYPNTFAGVILLFLPASLIAWWEMTPRLSLVSRLTLTSVFSLAAIACLYWSGSKSGWLLLLLVLLTGLWHAPISQKCKVVFLAGILALGITGFFLKYAGFFERGATSVVARMDYWKAALHITRQNPILGTGPGTFSIPYQAIKPPQAEMARLCHNDFLEQASDSGVVGFIAYGSFIFGAIIWLYRQRQIRNQPRLLTLWMGLTALNLQSFSEFNLYVPALAWPNFLFLGYLLGTADKNSSGKSATA